MEFETDSIEAVDIPPDLQLELNSARSIDSLPSLRSSQKHASSFDASKFQAFPDGLSASSSSIDSLNMLVERQRMRQLNHPQHQEHMTDAQGLIQQADVKETNEIFLKYDPISKRKVLNTYEIIKELGLGQHGKVKLARDLLTKQLVAIKIVDRHEKKERKFFRIKKTNSLTQSDKIKREIAIMKKCHYKHVVRLIEVLDDSKSRKIYLVLEYCSKGEVKWCPRDQMETEAHGPPLLSFQRTREIIRGVVLGLEYLHYQGVIHRDIKPANLLISGDGTVKISDFGVSLAATGSNSNESMESVDELELAKTAGTPAFFAPEICLGNEAFEKYNLKREELFKGSSISFMIDIWALGVTLYCLLFGMLPFISDYELELFEKIVNQPVSFPTYEEIKSNGISVVSCQEEYEAAKDIVNKLLEKNPMKRICIPEIKKHPMMCWDFEHLSSTDDEHITSKLEEIKEFQSNKEQLFKQISVSKRELKNAVLGVGKKIKESVFNTLPVNRRSSSKGESESVSTLHSDFDPKLASKKCSDSSFIVSEGSVVSNLGDVSTAAQYTNDKNFDENDNKNNDKQTRNAISLKSNSPELFKKGYSICNGNDNNDNEMTKEASQREMFEQELQKFDDKHDPKTIVNLPINSSFASLDSFYIDNYAMSNVGSNNDMGNRDSKITSSIFARPPSVSAIYPPSGGRRQNSNTIGNRLRSSSSRLDFLNSGIQSTRNERVPYNHSRVLQHSGRSSTDITLQHPSVGSSMSFGGKVNRKQAFNKPNEDNRSPSTNETESRKPATSNHQKVDNSKDNVKNFQIKRGNFFSSFNGQDEETSHSSGASSSGSSSYSSSSESDSEGSYAESLPFEFGVDSSNGSVVSMREVTGLDHVRPFMEVHSPRHASRKGSLDNGRQNKRNIGIPDDDENDDLVLSMGSAGRQRRQDSSQTSGSSAGSSRRNTLPYLYQGRGSDGAPAVDSVCTITPGNLTTITPHLWASGRQRSEEAPAELLNSSSKSSLSSGNANISHVSIHPSSASNLQYSNPGSTSGSLLLPLSNVKPTTQALNVDGILSKGRHQERFHDNSRKLLKTVLITSAEADRRQSVPSLTPSAQSSQRIPSSRINDTSVYTTSAPNHEQHHLEGRPSHNVVHEAPAKNEIRRSRSITIAELRKNKP